MKFYLENVLCNWVSLVEKGSDTARQMAEGAKLDSRRPEVVLYNWGLLEACFDIQRKLSELKDGELGALVTEALWFLDRYRPYGRPWIVYVSDVFPLVEETWARTVNQVARCLPDGMEGAKIVEEARQILTASPQR